MNFEKVKNFLVYAILFLLPWQTRWIFHPGELNGGYWEYGTISLYASEVLLWIAMLVYIVSAAKRDENVECRIWNLGTKRSLYSIFYILYSVVIGFFALRPDLHYYYLLRILEGVGLYFLIKSVDARKASWVFVLGMLPQALLGIYQFLTQSGFASTLLGMATHDPAILGTFVVETASGRWLRAYGGLPHPNVLGGYLVIAILLLTTHDSRLTTRTTSLTSLSFVVCRLSFVALTAALFFTFSRSAWLTLFVVLVVYFIITIRSRSLPYRNGIRIISGIVFVIVLTFFTLGTIFKEPLLSRAHADNRLETKSKIERIAGYEEAWKIFKKHSLVGVGLGNYTYAEYKEIDSSKPSYAYQPVHNIFILLVVEVGIVGILAIFSIFIHFLFRARSLALISVAILVIVLGLFDHYLVSLYSGIVLFAVISAILHRDRNYEITN